MKSFFTIGVALLGLSKSVTNAVAIPVEHMEMAPVGTRDLVESRQSTSPPCINGPTSRQCWTNGFCKFYDAEKHNPLNVNSGLYRHVHLVAEYWSNSVVQSPD
jgi:hypothetical protein